MAMKKVFFLLLFWGSLVYAQESNPPKSKMLLTDMAVQIESMEAVNALYNFKFEEADRQFRWFKLKYPDHPLPYFLLGLAEWWKMMPNPQVEEYDARFLAYMDTAGTKAEKMYDKNREDVEAAFFMAAAYGFKGRLYSERESWTKAAFAGKTALKYLDKFKNKEEFSIEFLFGDALYNYYREWIPENYKSLKPILIFFEHGDKKKGMEQLKQVAYNAFYTRTEAQYFLMRIYEDEKQTLEALQIARNLSQTYPDNPFFQRYYARMAYSSGLFDEAEKTSLNLMERLERGDVGYEATAGRYACFFLAYIYQYSPTKKDLLKSREYYKKAVAFAEQTKTFDSGYYHASLAALARMYVQQTEWAEAEKYYQALLDHAEHKSSAYEEAKKFMKEQKKRKRKN
jgi:hypothetical protein